MSVWTFFSALVWSWSRCFRSSVAWVPWILTFCPSNPTLKTTNRTLSNQATLERPGFSALLFTVFLFRQGHTHCSKRFLQGLHCWCVLVLSFVNIFNRAPFGVCHWYSRLIYPQNQIQKENNLLAIILHFSNMPLPYSCPPCKPFALPKEARIQLKNPGVLVSRKLSFKDLQNYFAWKVMQTLHSDKLCTITIA